MSATAAPLLDYALAAHAAGLCVLPPREDGTKAPDTDSWKARQAVLSTRQEIDDWYAAGRRSGIGYVTGAVSGNLELFDFDDRDSYETFIALARAAGYGDLVERIETGYLETSPAGMHWFYRCQTISGNTKLAQRPKRPEEMKDERDTVQVLIETRGEGGFVVAAPSNGRVHPDGGAYRLLRGGVDAIATITPAERAELHGLARSLDQMPKAAPRADAGTTGGAGKGKPGDDYNTRGDVLALLEAHGWRIVFERNGVTHLRRPGKDRGTSATFGIGGTRYFYCFTTSTLFEAERSYTPFAVAAALEHAGDFAAAARALAEQGFGDPRATATRSASREQSRPGAGDPAWPVLDDAALYGIAGDVVRAIEPHTESDPVAILVNMLVMFGAAVGRSPRTHVGATRHGVNLFAVLVGETARSRKGTGYHEVRRLFEPADPEFRGRIMGGLSSGEGLIYAVRDPVWQPDKKTGEPKLTDAGVDDKRLLIIEPEFSSPLRVAGRDGNTLSELLRRSWDGDDLRTMTRNSPLCATSPHISVLGHITKAELLRELSETSQLNGFGNRFDFMCVRRSRLLPDGGALDDQTVADLVRRVQRALATARQRAEVRRDDEAAALWRKVYTDLTADRRGMFGALTARAEAQTLRLSLLYALLDGDTAIRTPHLLAALAVWQYCEDSARYIFGDATGDPVADRVLTALRRNGPMAQNEIVDLFGRNVNAAKLGAALESLLRAGLIVSERVETGGRPRTVWQATP